MIEISKDEAKKFLLRRQGLLGDYRYQAISGVVDYIKDIGCVQFDPLDICGRNADIVLFSRVMDYKKSYLDEQLYLKRNLVDQWDKNISIYATSDWADMSRTRNHYAKIYENHLKDFQDEVTKVKKILEEKEFVRSSDLNIDGKAHFFTWRHMKLSQAILDYLFFKGEAIIHHRDRTIRYFCSAKRFLDPKEYNKDDPFATDEEYIKFQLKRRIRAIGLLGSGPSDAYLGMTKVLTPERKEYFKEMVEAGEIVEIKIEGVNGHLYTLPELLKYLDQDDNTKRLEFLAPLDNFLWDRKLIKKIFDYSYVWEIYYVAEKRKFGAYVLPVLYGSDLVARIEMVTETKTRKLILKNLWFEAEKPQDERFWKMFDERIKAFAEFNGCLKIDKRKFKIHSNVHEW